MKKNIILLTIILTLLAATFNVRPARAASAVVGDGSPASCTEAAFDTALASASSGGGTITFNCGAAVKTITFSGVKNILTGDVTINGNDLIVLNGGNVTRHFFVGSGRTFRLQHITLRDGNSGVGGGAIEASGAYIILESAQLINNYATAQGGAIYCYVGIDGTLTVSDSLFENNGSRFGGAIYNDGCMATISNSTFKTNTANDGVLGIGGAIYNSQPFTPSILTLTVNNSLLQGNSAVDGGGLYNDTGAAATLNSVTFIYNSSGYGGGVENSGTITINDSLIDANTVTGSGGGIWNLNGIVNVVRTRITNNSAFEGGGISSYGTHVEITNASIANNVTTGSDGGGIQIINGTVFITNATISGNQATGTNADGGGIYHNSADNLTLTNVTLANNQAASLGGGLYHYGRYAVLTNVTIGGNTAGVAGQAIYEDSPMTVLNPGVVQLKNSVLFGSSNNCDGGTFQSLGHNISKGSCAALNQPTDQNSFAGNLNLGTLAFNGGAFPMKTIMPLAGSPLIDAGDACVTTDQRGGARVGTCDIGAVEYGGLSPIFADVPVSYWAWEYVERLYSAGITGGCSASPLNYCPDSVVTRAQMAVFLLKGIHGKNFTPPVVGASSNFADVATDYWAAAWIKQLAAEGITGGCGAGIYCPDATVTRAQMAVFLLKAKHGSSYTPPSATGVFSDVPMGYWADRWIEQLSVEGVTSGCGVGIYCPDSDVTRAQMAVFLVKTFNLP